MAMQDIDRAYIAGFFDGEGCVSCYLGGSSTPKYPYLRITLVQKDARVLYEIRELLGYGTVSHGSGSNRDMWSLVVSGRRDVRTFLAAVAPFVRVKSRQVELAQIMLDLIGVPQTDETKAQRMALYHEIRKEKHVTP